MQAFFELLGHETRDRVSGFSGIADSVCFDLYGCVQISVVAKLPDGANDPEKIKGRWFDYKRLERISDAPVLPPPTFSFEQAGETRVAPGREPGPADKPARSW